LSDCEGDPHHQSPRAHNGFTKHERRHVSAAPETAEHLGAISRRCCNDIQELYAALSIGPEFGGPDMGELLEALSSADADIPPDERPDRTAGEKTADAVKAASQTVTDAIDAGRRPGMPLDTLARLTRESPLAALAIAFLFGVAISRPRYQPVRRRIF
jgi:hypothetical protein